MTVEQGAELAYVGRQVLRRHGGVLDERLRPRFALNVAEQAYRALAHRVDPAHRQGADRQRVAQARHRGVLLQVGNELFDTLLDHGQVVTAEFHQIDAQGRRLCVGGKVFGHAMPDDVVHGQQEDLGVHGFDRQRLVRHQGIGVVERVHEAGIAHIDQNRMPGDRQHVELGFDDEAQRAFRAAEYAVEVEAPVGLAQVGQVIAGEAAVEFGEDRVDQFGLLVGDGRCALIDLGDAAVARVVGL